VKYPLKSNRLACIIHSLGIGGMERVMAVLLPYFVQEGREVHLILIGRKREVVQAIPEEVILHKPGWPFDNRKRAWHSLKTMVFVRTTVQQIAPDVVLSFGEYWNNLVLLSLWGAPFPVYISDRSTPGKELGRLQNWLRQRLYPRAAGYIAQTEQAAAVARRHAWNRNIRVIGNPAPALEAGDPQSKIILNVGRLIPTKNIDRLIALFSQCEAALREEWRLVIVGGDAKKQQLSRALRAQSEASGLSEQILLEGAQQDVYPYYARSAIFAFTSTSEGFPNALAEAMSAGLAVIAYDCVAGPSDLIDDGYNGFLIPEGDEALYLQRLQALMADEALRVRLGKNAQQKMARFCPEQIAKQYLSFLQAH
jgi:glycosyltransferase involved in cell wall biosynthesis